MTETLVRFTKMSGAGNDFVVIDNRRKSLPEPLGALARAMCERKRSVGADGLIAVEGPVGDEDFSMRYYNADGSEADLCGNGARCVAAFAHGLGVAARVMRFTSRAGTHAATVGESGVSVTMPGPAESPRAIDVPLGSGQVRALRVTIGVPHAVIFTDDVTSTDVFAAGKRIRFNDAVCPEGANVDFVQVTGESRIRMRTYERGVEAETLACGTGAVASAVAACSEGLVTCPVEVETSGGDVLRVHGADGTDGFRGLRLEGPAEVIYDGVYGYRVCGGGGA